MDSAETYIIDECREIGRSKLEFSIKMDLMNYVVDVNRDDRGVDGEIKKLTGRKPKSDTGIKDTVIKESVFKSDAAIKPMQASLYDTERKWYQGSQGHDLHGARET